ncbi:hypothetical protein F4777DRAFT_161526 [Nemania sp. FL0916]|nr:hypothetical protein F4777DRAFT_161526 [Nemania sp. FL0916]
MQVLNAPSREELDAAHKKGSWMDVGVSSMRNLFKVSSFKKWCWLGLLITSLPIHLFFNSVVFNTEYREKNFSLTISTEEFVNGGSYYLPGASLLVGDTGADVNSTKTVNSTRISNPKTTRNSITTRNSTIFSNSTVYSDPGDQYDYLNSLQAVGYEYYLANYTDAHSGIPTNISSNAKDGKTWKRLSLSECQAEFGLFGTSCQGLRQYRDLILIADKPGGWIRNDMWHLKDNQTRVWDAYVPSNEPNHLFYYTTCSMSSNVDGSCQNDCHAALGGMINEDDNYVPSQSHSEYPFFVNGTLAFANGTEEGFGANWRTYHSQSPYLSGLQPGTFDISVQYCLARPFKSTCRLGTSPALLFTVVLCILGKTGIAILVSFILGRRGEKSFVTLGDYIAASIENPNSQTSDYAAASVTDYRRRIIVPGPRQWSVMNPRWARAIPRLVWAASYTLFIVAVSICLYLISTTIPTHETFAGSFLAGSQNPQIGLPIYSFISSVLVANSPQLLLSLSYIAFNNLFTYFCVATEWNSFASKYLPLRVTDPKGEQRSTYRLQLPYRYSLPLMALSASLHWLISNTIYVIVSEGGYLDSPWSDPTLLPDTGVVLGYSPISLIVLSSVAALVVTIPLFFSFKRLSSDIVVVRTNSLLISMASRVSPHLSLGPEHETKTPIASSDGEMLEYPMATYNTDRGDETRSLLTSTTSERSLKRHSTDSESNDEELTALQKIARSKIRWGVLPMSPEWRERHDYELLGFAVEPDQVTAPVQGRWYQ